MSSCILNFHHMYIVCTMYKGMYWRGQNSEMKIFVIFKKSHLYFLPPPAALSLSLLPSPNRFLSPSLPWHFCYLNFMFQSPRVISIPPPFSNIQYSGILDTNDFFLLKILFFFWFLWHYSLFIFIPRHWSHILGRP